MHAGCHRSPAVAQGNVGQGAPFGPPCPSDRHGARVAFPVRLTFAERDLLVTDFDVSHDMDLTEMLVQRLTWLRFVVRGCP
jgi:hypothetical protein